MHEKLRILIVDDNPIILDVLKKGLLRRKHHCVLVLNAEEALNELKSDSFDIMITDIVMPGLDGFELTRIAKELHPEMPVIIITGHGDEKSYDRAIEAKAADFINKPFTIKELLTRMENVLSI